MKPSKEYLIQFLTEPEKDLLNRMYPNGLPNTERVFDQIERTLLNREAQRKLKDEEISSLKSTQEIDVIKFKEKIASLENEIEEEMNKKDIERQKLDDYEVNKRLDMLQALEAGGVDNWDWYSESLEEWNKKYYS